MVVKGRTRSDPKRNAAHTALALLTCAVIGVSCSIDTNYFSEELPAYHSSSQTVWNSDESTISYFEQREQTLKTDPSRGIGLKAAASLGAGSAPIPKKSRFRVFLMMGQSNMVGYGKASKISAPYNQKHPRIRIWSKNEWQNLVPRQNFGPEVSFAHHLAKNFPEDTIGIIKVAVSGSGMNAWKPDWEWVAASQTGDALKGSLYRDMINAVSAARAETDFIIEGFFWKQGGRDGRNTALADSYQERFTDLVSHVRKDLGAPDLPVFVLTYFDEAGLEENRKLLERVRPNAMNLYLSKARVSSYIHNAYPVFHGKLPTRLDKVHFNTEGQIIHGTIAAKAYLNYYYTSSPTESDDQQIVDPPIPVF